VGQVPQGGPTTRSGAWTKLAASKLMHACSWGRAACVWQTRGRLCFNASLPGCRPTPGPLSACKTALNPLARHRQVNGNNTFNPEGVAKVTFASGGALALSPASRAAVAAVWKRAAVTDFPAWDTPLVTPAGPLGGGVPLDKAGAARSAGSDMVGAYL
jgi:hypothetical protein